MTNDTKLQRSAKPIWPKKQRSNKEPKQEEVEEVTGRIRIRLIPIWLRVIIVAVLFLLAIVFGLMFGYAALGDGEAMDALKWETWQHMLDIMRGVQ